MSYFRPPSRRFAKFACRASISLRYRAKRATCMEASIEVRLGEALAAARGWRTGTRIDALWGCGDDFGTICLVKSDRGCALNTRSNASRSLTVGLRSIPENEIAGKQGALWKLKLQSQSMVEVKHFELPEGRLGLVVPGDWFELVRPARKLQVA